VFGTALLLTAYCLIALGIGTILRHSGAAIATGIGLLFLPFLMLGVFPQHIRHADFESQRLELEREPSNEASHGGTPVKNLLLARARVPAKEARQRLWTPLRPSPGRSGVLSARHTISRRRYVASQSTAPLTSMRGGRAERELAGRRRGICNLSSREFSSHN
jgi:hypothetical protein